MKTHWRNRGMLGVAVGAALALICAACNGKDAVTAPSAPAGGASTNVAGTWSGSFQSYSSGCSGSSVSARLEQDGSDVKGSFISEGCGIRGTFRGTVAARMLTGRVEMSGCRGGVVTGTLNGSALTMTVGDFTKPVLYGDAIVAYGGTANLQR